MVSIVLVSLAWFEMKTHLPPQHNESGYQCGNAGFFRTNGGSLKDNDLRF